VERHVEEEHPVAAVAVPLRRVLELQRFQPLAVLCPLRLAASVVRVPAPAPVPEAVRLQRPLNLRPTFRRTAEW
jgi:hypothetical protein